MLPGGWAGAPDGSDLRVGLAVRADFHDLPTEGENPSIALLNWQQVVPR